MMHRTCREPDFPGTATTRRILVGRNRLLFFRGRAGINWETLDVAYTVHNDAKSAHLRLNMARAFSWRVVIYVVF
jgi:hypothetical protein